MLIIRRMRIAFLGMVLIAPKLCAVSASCFVAYFHESVHPVLFTLVAYFHESG